MVGNLLYGGELYSSLEYILVHLFYKDILSNLPEVLAVMLTCHVHVLQPVSYSHPISYSHPMFEMHICLVAKKNYFLCL